MAGNTPKKPDIKGLLRDKLRLSIMARCPNAEHNYVGQQCDWCDPVCNDLIAYAIARGTELREAKS